MFYKNIIKDEKSQFIEFQILNDVYEHFSSYCLYDALNLSLFFEKMVYKNMSKGVGMWGVI